MAVPIEPHQPNTGMAPTGELTLTPRPWLSVIIPARNEEAYLPKLLDTLESARSRYGGKPEEIEFIVVDNVSTDETTRVAEAWGCRVVTVETRNIGAVRNGGARAAQGEIFFFVDADLQMHPETFNEVAKALADPTTVGGCMGMQWDRWSLALAVSDVFGRVLEFVKRRPMGGGGTTFCRRDDFYAVGGYCEAHFGGEDIRIIKALQDYGAEQGRPNFVCLRRAKAIVSTRKMSYYGDWHLLRYGFRFVAIWLFAPKKARDWARPLWKEYWYGDHR